jgi:exopolysaccharide biosynthesis predicted pyruvyltransferase EpsI
MHHDVKTLAKAGAARLGEHDYVAEMGRLIDEIVRSVAPAGAYAHLGFPNIRNVGDSAIWLGEVAALKRRYGWGPAYVSTIGEFDADHLARRLPEGPIFLRGGGNFGDLWPSHQQFRVALLGRFPDRLVIQLPQSIQFESAELLDVTKRAIGAHRNFILLVRDQSSLDFARKHFDCRSHLCPDMAFVNGPLKPIGMPTFPILAMLREDKEKSRVDGPMGSGRIPVEDWIVDDQVEAEAAGKTAGRLAAWRMDGIARRAARYRAMARFRLRRGVRQLSRAHVVITDRLHVHIVSTLLGKPHAVLDNSYGKIAGFRAAFPGSDSLPVHAAASFATAEAWAWTIGRDAAQYGGLT